jgi:hypothetical protein
LRAFAVHSDDGGSVAEGGADFFPVAHGTRRGLHRERPVLYRCPAFAIVAGGIPVFSERYLCISNS